MEEENYDYQTSHFFNLDGPMYGANIPVSFQFMLKHIVNLEVATIDLSNFIPVFNGIKAKMASPGVKQQLIYSINLDDPNDNSITNQAFSDFQSILHSAGSTGDGKIYDCDYVVLCDGAINATAQQYADGSIMNPSDKLMSIFIDAPTLPLSNATNLEEDLLGISVVLWSLFTGTGLNIDMNAWALPDNPSSDTKIYEGKIQSIVLGIPVLSSHSSGKVKNTRPLDSSPGGYIDWVNYIPDILSGSINLHTPVICFVPTVSTLDIAPPNNVLLGDFSDESTLIASGNTPLLRYLGSESASNPVPNQNYNMINNFHALIHPEMARFLIHELVGGNPISEIGLTVLDNRTYNFGDSRTPFSNTGSDPAVFPMTKTWNHISQSLTVEGNGKIWINRDDKIAFIDEDNLPNAIPGIFQVFIYGENCTSDLPIVTVKDGGFITVGEWESGVENIGIMNVGHSATLNIERNGTVEVSDHSRINIESATVNVRSNGLLTASWPDAKIIVRNGGILRVHSGGTLRVNSGSQVIIEAGGTLLLEQGANINLWDGQDPEGLSTIHIKSGGKLVINGDMVFSGNGFFQFDNGNILQVADKFTLSGYTPTHRFIRLNQGASLVIPSGKALELYNGKIQYDQSARIYISDNARGTLNKTTLQGLSDNNSVGLWAETPEYVILSQSSSYGLESAAYISGVGTGHQTIFSDLKINVPAGGDKSGIVLKNCFNTPQLQSVKMESISGTNNMGLVSEYCKFINMLDCEMKNISFAITGKGVQGISLYNTLIDGGAKGIYNPKATLQFPMNVFLYNGTTIKNCEVGVEINGTSQSGLVLMDCAHLINNGVGVFGEDITLQIDATENQHCESDPAAPNEFNLGSNGLWHFNICYKHKIPSVINATGNYWVPANPSSSDWSVKKNDNCSVDIPVNAATPVSEAGFANCSAVSPCDPSNPGGNEMMKACPPVSHLSIDVDPKYHKGAVALFNQDYDLAEQELSEVAQLHTNFAPTLSNKCQDYVATSFAIFDIPALPVIQGKTNSKISLGIISRDELILPNPASDQFMIVPPQYEQVHVKIFNPLGALVYQTTISNTQEVECSNWVSGIYSVVLTGDSGNLISNNKIVIFH